MCEDKRTDVANILVGLAVTCGFNGNLPRDGEVVLDRMHEKPMEYPFAEAAGTPNIDALGIYRTILRVEVVATRLDIRTAVTWEMG